MTTTDAPFWLQGKASGMSRDELQRAISYLTKHERSKAALEGDTGDAPRGNAVDPAKLAAKIRAGMGPVQ